MSKPIEFSKFYKILYSVKEGDKTKEEELQWILAEYEHAQAGESAYDELGQIFCHIGIMRVYEYIGVDDIKYISSLENSVWDYLNKRTGKKLSDFLIEGMKDHAKRHDLTEKISAKWELQQLDLDKNLSGLANYVTEGIMEIIK